jgi:uncharacterized protein
MKQESYTPAEISIQLRNKKHELTDSLGRDWYDNHPFKTAWFNAMSITFPLGEQSFIDSVRHYAVKITDPKLQREIRHFCGQEGIHRREHELYNETLCKERNYSLDYLEGRIARKIKESSTKLLPIQRLAVTAALEHITAILAERMLGEDVDAHGVIEAPMKELWTWHAAEEMEHKAVVFDVYRAVTKNKPNSEKMRKSSLRLATFFLMKDIVVGMIHMLRRDKKMWNLRVWIEGMQFLLGRQGLLRLSWPAYKEYFKEDFHPWQRDTRSLLENWEKGQLSPD